MAHIGDASKLSPAIRGLRFMQRQLLNQERSVDEDNVHDSANGASVSANANRKARRSIVVQDSFVGVEDLYSGRQSFQGFNPDTERTARAQAKARQKEEEKLAQVEIQENRVKAQDVKDHEMAERLTRFIGSSKSAKRASGESMASDSLISDNTAQSRDHTGSNKRRKKKKKKSGIGGQQ